MDLVIGDVFRNAARAAPERVAVRCGPDALTFRELDMRSNGTARAAAAAGVARGDLVVVPCPTSTEVVVLFAALAKLGAVLTPVNPALGSAELAEILDTARPSVVLAGAQDLAITELARERGVSLVPAEELTAGQGIDTSPVALTVSESDPHVVFYTSGSTGSPRGVVLSHRVNYLRTHPGALPEPRGAAVCPYPLFHMAAWTIALQQWQARDTAVLLGSADALSICDAVARNQATRLNCIPAVWRRIIDHLSDSGALKVLPTLQFADTGTSATPPELLAAIERIAPNASVRVFYGSTEAGSVAALEKADIAEKPGRCGVPGPAVEVRLGTNDELQVRGALLFDGYHNDPAATAEAFDDGWYRTGDRASIDEGGYITIVGRLRDVIRTGGETVAPSEVEEAVAKHPAVADVAVVGIPDTTWGEIVCAAIVVEAGAAAPTVEDLNAFCGAALASFKRPRRVEIVGRIPRTASTGQVQRAWLTQQLA